MEFTKFLESSSQQDMCKALPDDVINFLIWKNGFVKTIVHFDARPLFGEKSASSCSCPTRLGYGSVDSLIGKLRAIFNKYGRSAIYISLICIRINLQWSIVNP